MSFIIAQPVNYSFVSNSTPTGFNGQIFNAGFRNFTYIQVISTGSPLYVSYNGNPASATNYNFVLKPATSAVGDGGVLMDYNWTGPVCVSGSNVTYIAWSA